MYAILLRTILPALLFLPVPASAQVDCSVPSGATRTYCSEQELKRADDALNAAWSEARSAAKTFDDTYQDLPGTPMWEQLLASQRQWLRYRDVTCEAEAKPASLGGSGYGGALNECATRLTLRRTDDLHALSDRLR